MKTEIWNGHEIRFVKKDGEWWAVAKDIADALDYAETRNMMSLVPNKYTSSCKMDDEVQRRSYIIVSEFGIYKAIFGSHKKEAEQFQEWVFEVLKELRIQSGLEGFEIFRMLDKEHQKEAMNRLCNNLKKPVRVNFIKANTIANKTVSDKHGYPKMIKKGQMTPEMLVERESILDGVVELMSVVDKYGLDISVSQKVRELQTA